MCQFKRVYVVGFEHPTYIQVAVYDMNLPGFTNESLVLIDETVARQVFDRIHSPRYDLPAGEVTLGFYAVVIVSNGSVRQKWWTKFFCAEVSKGDNKRLEEIVSGKIPLKKAVLVATP